MESINSLKKFIFFKIIDMLKINLYQMSKACFREIELLSLYGST